MSTEKKNLVGLVPKPIADFVEDLSGRWNQNKIDIVIYGLQLIAEKHGQDWPAGYGFAPDSVLYQMTPTPKPKQKK